MAEEGEAEVRRRRRWPRALFIVLTLLGVALAGLWIVRKPLARGEVDRFLAEARVPGRYTIADLGPGRQRLTNVVIGDPARPDLVADWLETRTAWGWRGPYLAGVRGGRVRVRARWQDGKLSLGAVDRLLPAGEGGTFSLPKLSVDIQDLRARIETPSGVIGAKLVGRGRLDSGFDGRLAVTASRLGNDCGVSGPGAVVRVATRPGVVRLEGSAQASAMSCADVTAGYTQLSGSGEIALGNTLTWSLRADVAAQDPRHPQARALRIVGRVKVVGGPKITGSVALTAADARGFGVRGGQLSVDGDVVRDMSRQVAFGYDGKLAVVDADARALLPRLDPASLAGTPVAPLAAALKTALDQAAGRLEGEAQVNLSTGPMGTYTSIASVELRSASGVRATLSDGVGLRWRSTGELMVDGTVMARGGGLPSLTARIARPAAGPLRTTVQIEPYAADDARVAFSSVTISGLDNVWRVATRATLSGPVAAGRVDGLTLPIDARVSGAQIEQLGCAPIGWSRVAVSGLVLGPGALRLCPERGGALVRVASGGLSGAARTGAARLTGRLGASPLTLTVADARLDLAARSFTMSGVAAQLGQPERATRLTSATLDGRIDGRGIVGRFNAAGGKIGAVPLVMSGAAGDWRYANGALRVEGALTVSDAQTERPRLRPLPVRDIALTQRGPLIEATGSVRAPTDGRKVADIRIVHNLPRGAGSADLIVPGLNFDKELQPDRLTPLTFGVIADVRGTVSGEGRINWTPERITSTGIFRTSGTDLAAAFGPVQGIAGEIRFTDLLALESAPGQRLTVKSINPGVPVTDGVVTFQLLRDTRVAVAGARWPFAGGELVLEPTLLNFATAAERRLTFRVAGAAADKFLQSFDFKNLNATGTFDGVLPMVFDDRGGRIENGRLTVREGGGTLAYVGAVNQENLGFWGNFAFDALKSLRYRSLGIVMNGPLAGEMVTEVRFTGITQGEGAKTNFIIRRLQRLPIAFNIRIRAPFRGLLDATASFYDPRRLIERNLPELIERQNRAVQPPASETVP